MQFWFDKKQIKSKIGTSYECNERIFPRNLITSGLEWLRNRFSLENLMCRSI